MTQDNYDRYYKYLDMLSAYGREGEVSDLVEHFNVSKYEAFRILINWAESQKESE